jgi:adenosylcobinamide-phosphate synthase
MSGRALAAGWALDLAAGDPRRWHPVAGFGQVALALERAVYAPTRRRGAAFAFALIAGAAVAGEALARLARRAGGRRGWALAALTWSALGGRSLVREARRVAAHVEHGDLPAARAALPALAGRDAAELDGDELARAVVESVAENTSDAVVGVLVWGALAGPAGVAAYRAATPLDAMVGHRSDRYARFGWAAARIDDAVNWPAARYGALLTAACAPLVGGSPRQTWRIVRRDGGAHPSPNAGRMEAAFAGALDLRLGGPLAYGGRHEARPLLGDGRPPRAADVARAAGLSLAVGLAAAGSCGLARGARAARAAARKAPR